MAEANQSQASNGPRPPPAPPLPPPRPGVLQRFIAPLAFGRSQRLQDIHVAPSSSASPKDITHSRPYTRPPPRAAVHRTGIPIAAIDINESKTHAILAGRDILKTVKVQDRHIAEDLNIRSAVNHYISTQALKPDDVHKRREFLPAKDVRWSHKHYSHVVATAAQNGRVALYDVSRDSSRVELHHLYQHTGQVNKLDFDPHAGYMLLSGSQDKFCKIWDIREPKKPKGFVQFLVRAPIRNVQWSPNDAWEFALCTEEGTIQKWDVRKPHQAVLSIKAHEKSCYTIAWHPDGKHLVSGGVDKNLKVWDFKRDNNRQKPVLQVRCPAGIMNLAWRPPCWSAEFAERGTWQSTQIATSYTDDDPRIHLWDLRRPLIPFRELSQYDSRPMDLLWADKDLLWTVGGAGVFAQNDMSYAAQPEDSLPPGAISWAPDGSFYAVTEDRNPGRRVSATDPSAIFLNVPQERLSGADEGMISRSLTDDEGTDTSFAEYTSRRQSKSATTRSTKSQVNTPPSREESKVLPLDRAVLAKKDMFSHDQIGAMTRVPGVYIPTKTVGAVANNYAKPMTARERKAEPDKILPRLKSAFDQNQAVAIAAGLHDQAQNWQAMRLVVVSELKIWADNNRKRRLDAENAERQAKEDDMSKAASHSVLSPFAKVKNGISPARSDKAISLFRGVLETQRGASDSRSQGGSNLTTPRQRPLLSSPATSRQAGSTWFTLDDAIEPMQPLPPSLANAHSTATAASRALFDNSSDPSDSPLSSPERTRFSPDKSRGHRRSATENVATTPSHPNPEASPRSALRPIPYHNAHTPIAYRTQEDRRAALRDYRAPTRQPFTLEAPLGSPSVGRGHRHDSAESLAMFSASTPSSANARSIPRSFMEEEEEEEEEDDAREGEQGPEGSSRESAVKLTAASLIDISESPSLPFGLDGQSDSKPVASGAVESKFREALARDLRSKDDVEERPVRPAKERKVNALSTGGKLSVDGKRPRVPCLDRDIRHWNPLRTGVESEGESLSKIPEGDVSLESGYHASDFRPIDITKYEPLGLFALSAYPMMAAAIELDVNHGSSSSQFSAHLLSHVIPFFFHPTFRSSPSQDDLANLPRTTSDRLQHPAFSARTIQAIFVHHINYLSNLGLSLAEAEMRRLCVDEFDFPTLAGRHARTQQSSTQGDTLKTDDRLIKSTCSNCKHSMALNATFCKSCSSFREKCPICEIHLSKKTIESTLDIQGPSNLNAYCHACGHSAHLTCMTTWLSLPDTHGECPTPGCGCDCGPGQLRDQRIARQVAEQEDQAVRKSTSGSSNIRKDSKVARPSPAVDKARDTLRKRSSGGIQGVERATQSGDEARITPGSGSTGLSSGHSVWSRKGTSAGRGFGGSAGISGATQLSRSGSEGAGAGASFSRRPLRVAESMEDEDEAITNDD